MHSCGAVDGPPGVGPTETEFVDVHIRDPRNNANRPNYLIDKPREVIESMPKEKAKRRRASKEWN
jgi:hypothetical protein